MHIANLLFSFNRARQGDIKDSFAMTSAIKPLSKPCLFGSKTHIRAFGNKGKTNKFITAGIVRTILKLSVISKQEDMQEKKGLLEAILSKNGKISKRNTAFIVLVVESIRSLPKTISNHFRLVGQIIYQISNRFVVIATVKSGRSFNIHEHPHLLEQKSG